MQKLILFLALIPLLTSPAQARDGNTSLQKWRLPEVSDKAPPAAVNLGKKLFFEPRLLGESSLSCANCHNPGLSWSDPVPIQRRQGHLLARQTPSLINVVYYRRFFWDGRATDLTSAIEQHLKELAATAGETTSLPEDYKPLFEKAFGSPTKTPEIIAKSLADFLATLVTRDSAFDHWLAGDEQAIPPAAQKGFALFTGKAGCASCHTPPLFSDSQVHNIGLNTMDPGFYEITGRPEHRNAFRTPQLRQIATTAPYMHTGSLLKLRHVIDYFDRGGDRRTPNNRLKELHLSETEKQQLEAFLKSLSGTSPRVTVPQLPPNRY